MKKLPDPPMPVSFWPHAVVQMAAFVVYILVLGPRGISPTVQTRLGALEEVVGWSLPFILWVVYVYLLGELVTRLTQRWSANVFPFQHTLFVALQIALAVPLTYVMFVGLECVLFFVALGRYPLQLGASGFDQGLLLTLKADAPWMLVLGAGELLRHWLYAGHIRKWHHDRGLRLLPLEVE